MTILGVIVVSALMGLGVGLVAGGLQTSLRLVPLGLLSIAASVVVAFAWP